MANFIIRSVVSLLIILAAIGIGRLIINTKKPAKSQQPPAVIPQVTSLKIDKANYQPEVKSFGNVQSYFETTLTAQISGRIIAVDHSFRVGEKVSEGEVLALIDDTDYQATLATQEANLTLQQRSLAEEKIRSKQAEEDWLASGRKLSSASEFVLRKPQLAAAQANIKAAEAAIKRAKADIQRTRIIAPYDAIITERTASVGNFANPQSPLGKLVATKQAEVRIPLSAEQLLRVKLVKDTVLTLTKPGSPQVKWEAKFSRMEPTVDPRNQVSYAIAIIDSPYASATQPLPVGSFVNVALPANVIKDAFRVPEAALVNDRYLWLVDAESKLVKVSAERIQSADSFSYVKLKSDKKQTSIQLVTRPLSTFRNGMKVQDVGSEDASEKKPSNSSNTKRSS